jgi:hypothetical protein
VRNPLDNNTNTLTEYCTTGIAARVTGYSEAWMRKIADKGVIRSVRTVGGLRLLLLEDCHRYAAERRSRRG